MTFEEMIIEIVESNFEQYYNRKPTLDELNLWIDNKLNNLLKEI